MSQKMTLKDLRKFMLEIYFKRISLNKESSKKQQR